MKAAGGLLGVLMVAAIGLYIFKAQLQIGSGETVPPKQQIDTVGVRTHLLAIAQAERRYAAVHGTYAGIAELQSKGFLPNSGSLLRGYNFDARVDGDRHFIISATPLEANSTGLPNLVIDETMKVERR